MKGSKGSNPLFVVYFKEARCVGWMPAMNSCLVTRKENSIELEDYSFQWLTLVLPKLHPKNWNKNENEEERTKLIFECQACFWLFMKFVASRQRAWWCGVRIFGVSGVGEDGLGPAPGHHPDNLKSSSSEAQSTLHTSCPKHRMLSRTIKKIFFFKSQKIIFGLNWM